MSSLYSIVAPVEFRSLTTRDLAAKSHEAEDTGDDILLLQVDDEIRRREKLMPGSFEMYRKHYMDLIRCRMAKKCPS